MAVICQNLLVPSICSLPVNSSMCKSMSVEHSSSGNSLKSKNLNSSNKVLFYYAALKFLKLQCHNKTIHYTFMSENCSPGLSLKCGRDVSF